MLNSLLVFAVSFTPETLNFGTFGGVVHPSPFEDFFFNCVYAPILNLNYKSILILKKLKLVISVYRTPLLDKLDHLYSTFYNFLIAFNMKYKKN